MTPTSALAWHAAWIVPLLLLILYLHSPRFRGDIAQSRVRRLLASGLERSRYTVFDDLVLPAGGGSVDINHVVVSRLGIFVIKSVYARGWVSGGEFQASWGQKHLLHTGRMDNPVHRNRVQREALQQLLDYPPSVFHSLVVIVGHRGFRKRPPENVVSPESVLAWIRRKSRDVLSAEQANDAIATLDRARLRSRGMRTHRRWFLLRLLLWLTLAAGLWLAFADQLPLGESAAPAASGQPADAPERHPGGQPKSEREVWEDSLVCAFSADTGRCACYEPDGNRAELDTARCQALAERGSVLQR